MAYKSLIMTDAEFKNTLEKAKAELIANQHRLGKVLQEQEDIEKRNANLREVIAVMSRLLGEQFVEEDALGLTDAIRQAFKGSSTPLQPTEVRSRLQSIGYDISKYGNVMASIHSVINRLQSRGEITPATVGGKPAYQWSPRARMADLADDIRTATEAALKASAQPNKGLAPRKEGFDYSKSPKPPEKK